MISNANADGRDEELDWLIATANDLGGRYGNDWRGDAQNGEGKGSAQYQEYFNLMETMQNGGNWDVLGNAMGSDGVTEFTGDVTADNDGTGGVWGGFSSADQDAWIATLDSGTMGNTWIADNQGTNNKYQENYDQQFGYREPGPTNAPAETTTRATVIIGIGQAIDPADLEHASCLMDEQLDMIADFFTAKNVDTTTVQTIKDEAKQYLQESVVSCYETITGNTAL